MSNMQALFTGKRYFGNMAEGERKKKGEYGHFFIEGKKRGKPYKACLKNDHVFLSKLYPQRRQVMRILPLFLGTRTICLQPGQVKKAYSLR